MKVVELWPEGNGHSIAIILFNSLSAYAQLVSEKWKKWSVWTRGGKKVLITFHASLKPNHS